MKLLFIRHAKALKRDEWSDDDLLRPLSEKGIKVSKEFFSKLPKIFDIDIIISSKAKRAYETAEILSQYYPNSIFTTSKLLNPGASYIDINILLQEYIDYENIALVGHEPDISQIVSNILGCKYINIDVKKSSVIELSGENLDEMVLKSFIYPKLLKDLK
ncbi:SixA phosphatase family protein [Nitrosophilus kaiyonis]|uniref:SixA phosphatase family protein n=1 Tax=Nitrosophilus kaiyonis TaxID=2930200 RepID=UPI002491EF1D|nr:histidine phosphatase family protein [Nitrosophilus kaiyonis]